MRRPAALLVSLSLALIATPLAAQAHPNFSGNWMFDAKNSQVPAQALPDSLTMQIVQTDTTMHVDRQMQTMGTKQTNSMTFALNGGDSKNSVNTQGMQLDMTSKTSWAGDTLLVATSTQVQGQELLQNDRWILGPDKKTLVVDTSVNIAGQSAGYRIAFVKQ